MDGDCVLMSADNLHPAHGVVLEIGGVAHTVRATFAISRAIEECYGSVIEMAQKVLGQRATVTELADLLELMAPKASRGEIEAHFDEVGIGGVIFDVSSVFAQIMRGWNSLNAEVEKSAPLAKASRAGRPRGARNRPKITTDVCPGVTSSAGPQGSASCPETSGSLPLMNSPASGGQPDPQPIAVQAQPQNSAECQQTSLTQPVLTTPTNCAGSFEALPNPAPQEQ